MHQSITKLVRRLSLTRAELPSDSHSAQPGHVKLQKHVNPPKEAQRPPLRHHHPPAAWAQAEDGVGGCRARAGSSRRGGGDVARGERGRAQAGPTVCPGPAMAAVGARPVPGTEHQHSPNGAAGTSSSGKGGSRDGGSSKGPAGGGPSMDAPPAWAGLHQPKGAERRRRARG